MATDTTTTTVVDNDKSSRKSWRYVLRVHPAADVYPLLPPDQLKELAADIDRNGLTQKVVTWRAPDGTLYLLDGRNRLDAMEELGQPLVEITGGVAALKASLVEERVLPDPVAFVISTNMRRSLTARQRVMMAARAIAAGEAMAANTEDGSPVKRRRGQPKSRTTKVAEAAQVDKKTARKHLKAAAQTGELSEAEAGVKADRELKAVPPTKTPGSPSAVEDDDKLARVAAQALERIKAARLGNPGVEAIRRATASMARIERELAANQGPEALLRKDVDEDEREEA